MTKEKYNLYSLETTEELINKDVRQSARVFYFTIGFFIGIILTIVIFVPNV